MNLVDVVLKNVQNGIVNIDVSNINKQTIKILIKDNQKSPQVNESLQSVTAYIEQSSEKLVKKQLKRYTQQIYQNGLIEHEQDQNGNTYSFFITDIKKLNIPNNQYADIEDNPQYHSDLNLQVLNQSQFQNANNPNLMINSSNPLNNLALNSNQDNNILQHRDFGSNSFNSLDQSNISYSYSNNKPARKQTISNPRKNINRTNSLQNNLRQNVIQNQNELENYLKDVFISQQDYQIEKSLKNVSENCSQYGQQNQSSNNIFQNFYYGEDSQDTNNMVKKIPSNLNQIKECQEENVDLNNNENPQIWGTEINFVNETIMPKINTTELQSQNDKKFSQKDLDDQKIRVQKLVEEQKEENLGKTGNLKKNEYEQFKKQKYQDYLMKKQFQQEEAQQKLEKLNQLQSDYEKAFQIQQNNNSSSNESNKVLDILIQSERGQNQNQRISLSTQSLSEYKIDKDEDTIKDLPQKGIDLQSIIEQSSIDEFTNSQMPVSNFQIVGGNSQKNSMLIHDFQKSDIKSQNSLLIKQQSSNLSKFEAKNGRIDNLGSTISKNEQIPLNIQNNKLNSTINSKDQKNYNVINLNQFLEQDNEIFSGLDSVNTTEKGNIKQESFKSNFQLESVIGQNSKKIKQYTNTNTNTFSQTYANMTTNCSQINQNNFTDSSNIVAKQIQQIQQSPSNKEKIQQQICCNQIILIENNETIYKQNFTNLSQELQEQLLQKTSTMEQALQKIKNKFNESQCCKFYKLILINLDILENNQEQIFFKQINQFCNQNSRGKGKKQKLFQVIGITTESQKSYEYDFKPIKIDISKLNSLIENELQINLQN